MALGSCLRITFFCLTGIFFLYTLLWEIWRKKWKRLALDIFVYFIQMPLWLGLGIAILSVSPDLIYSYFGAIWLLAGILLWIAPHSVMAIKSIRRKDWLDAAYSLAGVLAIISFCAFIYFRLNG